MANRIPNAELKAALRELADGLGRTPTYREMDAHGRYGKSVYYHRWGSWPEACEAADVGRPDQTSYSDAALLEDLEDLVDELGRAPTSREVNELTEHSYSTYHRRFGGLEAAFREIDVDYSGRRAYDPKAEALRAAVVESPHAEIDVDDMAAAPEVGQWG